MKQHPSTLRLFCLFALLAGAAPAAAAADRYVSMNGADSGLCHSIAQACRTVGYALDVAQTGDRVIVGPGEFSQALLIDRNVSIQGSGPGLTILQPPLQGNGDGQERVITIEAGHEVSISAVTIERGAAHHANGQHDGGGIYSRAAALTLSKLLIEDNRSGRRGGGLYHDGGELILRNVVITGNLASDPSGTSWGGGIYVASGQVEIVNSTIARNLASQGGGLYLNGAETRVSNGIVWENIAFDGLGNEINNNSTQVIELRHSTFRDRPGESDIVEGGGIQADAGCLNDDPMWVGTTWQDRDFRLRPMSPAVNAASNAFYQQGGGDPSADTDMAGQERVWAFADGGVIDMGAYEFQGQPAQLAAPQLLAPDPDAFDLPVPLSFDWSSVDEADSYQLQIADAADDIHHAFNTPDVDEIVSGTSFVTTDLDPLHDYDWRVRAIMNGFVGEWSEVRRLTTEGLLQPSADNVLHITPYTLGDGTGRSWNNAHGSLARALKWAAHNEHKNLWSAENPLRIWVAEGQYRPEFRPEDLIDPLQTSPDISLVLVPNVQIYGGFPIDGAPDMEARDPRAHPTFIGSEGTGSRNLVIAAGALGNARLDGFTIRGGVASGTRILQVRGEPVQQTFGAGIYLVNSAPVLANLRISGNEAVDFGAGIFADNSQARLDRIRLENNSTSGLWGGGLASQYSDLVISNSLIAANQAPYGGGIHQVGGQLRLVNTTIVGNSAINGGGLYNAAGQLTLDNSILWSNQAENLGHQFFNEMGTGQWRYSLFANGPDDLIGIEALSVEQASHQNPQFVDPDGGVYLPDADSPAIDSGSNALYSAGTSPDSLSDLAGNPRIANGIVDRGALEAPPPPTDRVFRDRFDSQP